jgi:toxin ParE1/3/4
MATKSANVYARIEPDVKEQAEGILAALGIPASNAINMFYKQIILQRGLPFEVKMPSARPVDVSALSEAQMNAELEKGYADMQAGRTRSAKSVFADPQGLQFMIYDIVISDQAEIDLRGILEYIAFELQAPENASGQLDRLEACIMDLDHMPKRYRQYELEPWKSRGLRVAPVDNYLILYIPDDDTQVVTIIRVMYGGRDVDTQLNRFTKTK